MRYDATLSLAAWCGDLLRVVLFGLPTEGTLRFITLKARIFVERGIYRIGNLGRIGRFLVVRFAWDCWSKIDNFTGLFVDQHEILVGMRLLFAAVVLLLLGRVDWALAAVFGPINGDIWGSFPRQGMHCHAPGVAVWPHPEVRQRLLQHGEHMMHPAVGLGLTHRTL